MNLEPILMLKMIELFVEYFPRMAKGFLQQL
jgi:hypothetical protein